MAKGELGLSEPHPASIDAMHWVRTVPLSELWKWQETFASEAIEGNRLAEICGETLNRLLNNKPVSDRYLLGLAWVIHREKTL
jgi:hypothetical protein